MQALLKAGADKNVKDPDGKTALEHAQTLKHAALAGLLASRR